MCLLLLLHRVAADWPVVVAANRDEEYTRESLPPLRWPDDPAIMAPLDVRAGGTWIGVNQHGLLAGITNRPATTPDLRRRSRGLLCRDALRARSAQEAARHVEREARREAYNPFNVLVADGERAFVVHGSEAGPETVDLPPGVHVLTNFHDVDSLFLAEVIARFDPVTVARSESTDRIITHVAAICRDHEVRVPGDRAICKHLGSRGTVSSTIALLPAGSSKHGRFLYSDGPPCVTPYRDLSSLLEAR